MLTPIVCFTCGCSLGDIAPIYNIIRIKRMTKHYGKSDFRDETTAPSQVAMDPDLTENIMGDVLDALKVTKCCRTRLITAMILSEHY